MVHVGKKIGDIWFIGTNIEGTLWQHPKLGIYIL